MVLAIVKKEIRQWFAVILVGLCVVSLGYCHVLASHGLPNWIRGFSRYGGAVPLLSDRQLVVTVLYGVLGFVLAFLPTSSESESGKQTWVLLLRLPMSRGRLLLGKALGGVAMYLIAAVPPLVLAVLWAAIPGHYPSPFRIGMAAPAVADLLTGLVVYFGVLVFGIRWKRGLGVSFGALLLIAGVAVRATFFTKSFLAVVLIDIGAMALLYWAAYVSFARRDF